MAVIGAAGVRAAKRRKGCAVLALALLASCTTSAAIHTAPLPPLRDVQNRTESNASAIAAFVSGDPGWQAWLTAAAAADAAAAALVDASTQDVPAVALDAALTRAKDAYRRATSFYLVPVLMRSSCLNLASETTGALRLPSGLVLRYRLVKTETAVFPDGARCQRSEGFVSEVDSHRGLTIFLVPNGRVVDWESNLALSLVWNAPFRQIAEENSYSDSELISLIGR